MKCSVMGLAELIGHEAIVTAPYRNPGDVWTFGIGHTASAGDPDPAKMSKGLQQPLDYILEVFRKDIATFEARVNRLVKVDISQPEFEALVSFDYNTGGLEYFVKGKKRNAAILTHLNNGDRVAAAKSFDNWHKPPTLIGRRNKEKKLFSRGLYSNMGLALEYSANEAGVVQWTRGRSVNVLQLLQALRPVEPPATVVNETNGEEPELNWFLRLLRAIFGPRDES